MTEEIALTHPAATGIVLAVLLAGTALWFSPLRLRLYDPPLRPLPAWRISWIDFGLWFWGLMVSVIFAQLLVQFILRNWFNGAITGPLPEADASTVILAGLTLQVPLLLFFFAIRALIPDRFGLELSPRHLPVAILAGQSLRFLLLLMPFVWAVSVSWNGILALLEILGMELDRSPQDIVTIISRVEDLLPLIGFAFLALVLAPVAEELIFRGGIYRFLKGRMKVSLALFSSALLFALLHANVASFLPLLFLGMSLGFLYERTGDIRVPICIHAIFNGYQFLILMLVRPENLPV